jgi:hypothetical protein
MGNAYLYFNGDEDKNIYRVYCTSFTGACSSGDSSAYKVAPTSVWIDIEPSGTLRSDYFYLTEVQP